MTNLPDDFGDIMGMGIMAATEACRSRGIERVRAKRVDGRTQVVTMDHRKDRLNVETKGGQIVHILGVG